MSRIIEIEINCCGDCPFYDKKKHRCTKGAVNEGEGKDRFYKDCPLVWRNTESTDITPHQ